MAGFIQLYQVISQTSIVVQDGALAISYSPGQLFYASPKNPSVVQLLKIGHIVASTGLNAQGQALDGITLIPDSQLAELYIKANGTRAFSGSQSMGGHSLTQIASLSLRGATSGSIAIQAPAVAGTQTYTLPVNTGTSGYFLQTDGSGVLSWAAAGGTGPWTRVGSEVHLTTPTDSVLIQSGLISSPGIGADSEQFGLNADAEGTGALAIGNSAIARGNQAVAIGLLAVAGAGNTPPETSCVAVGYFAQATEGTYHIAVGDNATATGPSDGVAVGRAAVAWGTNNVAIGNGAHGGFGNTSLYCVGIGDGAHAGVDGDNKMIAIGHAVTASGGSQAILIGNDGTVTGGQLIALGGSIILDGGNAIGIGYGVTNHDSSDAPVNNVFVVGGPGNPITDVYFGTGISSTGAGAPSNTTIHATGGSATVNQDGADLIFAGGLGFLNASVGGKVRVQVAHTGSATTLVDSWVFRNDGAYELTGLTSDPAVSGGTNAALYYNTSTQKIRTSFNGAAFTDFGAGGGGVTLDGAYDFGGAGAGRTITSDSGAVRINKTSVDANNGFEVVVSAGTGLAALFSGANISCPGSGTTSEKFGAGVTLNGTASFSIGIGGTGAVTNSTDCVVIGHNSTAGSNSSDDHSIVLGENSFGYARRTVVIGRNNTGGASATGSTGMIAIGDGAYAGTPTQFDFDCIAMGDTALAGGFIPTTGSPGGTVSVTNGSPTVNASSINVFTGFATGQSVIFASQPGSSYTILTINSASQITLSTNYTGTTNAATQLITGIGNGDYIAIGLAAKALGGRGENTAIGTNAIAGWTPADAFCIAIGLNSKAYGTNSGSLGSIAIGRTANSFGADSSIAIGGSAIAGALGGNGSNFISIGLSTTTGLQNCVCIGTGTAGLGNAANSVGDQYCFLVGSGTAAGRNTVFAGSNLTNVTNGSPTVTNASGLFTSQLFPGAEIQFNSQAGTYYTVQSIASDTSLTLTTNYTGTTSTTTNISQRVRNVIVLGQSSNGEIAGGLTGTGARYGNCLVAGSIAGPITDVYFGSGIQSEGSTAPSAAIIHGSNGSKTVSQNGAAIGLAGGLGYGAGNVAGNVNFYTARTGAARTLTLAGFFNAPDGTLSVPGAGSNSQRFGLNSVATANNSTALGYQATVTSGATGGTSLGYQSTLAAPCLHSIAVGDNAFGVTTQRGIFMGWGAGESPGIASAADNIAIGDGVSIGGKQDCIAIGDFGQAGGSATDTDDISIGNSNIIYGRRCVGIGFGTSVSQTSAVDTLLFGFGSADWGGTNSQSNCFISGSTAHPITSVWFGSGMNSGGAAPTVWSLRGSENWGSVSNKNGADLNIVAGRGYNGGTGGDLHLRTSNVAGGGVIGTEQDVGVFDHLGNAQLGLSTTTESSTDGFVYIPAGTTTGPPSGTPTSKSGFVPLWYDTTNNKLWIYNSGWKTTTVFA